MQLLREFKALITGGTAGIGKAIAEAYAKEGASVAIFGTNEERASQLITHLRSLYPEQKFSYAIVDVSQTKEVETAILALLSEWESIDILVNNAGITRDALLMRMSEEDWDRVLDVNLKSAYNTCKAVVRSMMKARSGSIINISSVVGLTGNAGQINYSASKSGLIGFTKSLAKELASRGIRANCIAPGYIQTSMTGALPESTKQAILSKIPLARMGQPEDIAQAAVFLASRNSTYITGQALSVCGGMVMN